MQPFFNRIVNLDPKAPEFIPTGPLIAGSGATNVVPYTKPIKKGCEFDKQIDRVDQRLIILKPNHSHEIFQKEDWNFPEINFTVKELREYLERNLNCESWIIGGAANPACLPYNDIDMGFYIENPNYPQIDYLILEFIKAKLTQKRSTHTHFFHLDKGWLIQKVFFSGRVLFKENAGAFYGLQDLQIKIFQSPVFHCVSPSDGAQVSPGSRVLRFAMGKKFATTEAEFYKSLSYCQRKIYEIVDIEGHRDLLFRLVFKKSTGHKVEARLFQIAIQQLQVQLQQEYKEKSAMSFARHTFQRIDSRQNIPTVQDLLVGKLKNHQTNHFVSAKGKIIDFFNFMSILSTQQQREFAQAWLNNTEALGLKQINAFAKLIVHSPNITPLLLKLIRGVFFCEWANQPEGRKGRLFAFERALPAVKEVINEASVKEEYPDELGMHIAMKDGDHTYFLSLEENSSPVQIAKDLLDCIPELEALAKKCTPERLYLLKEAFIQLNVDPAYVSAEKGTHIEKRLLTAFDGKHVQEILERWFTNHYDPNTVLNDPKVILALIGNHLKDPKDRQVHAHKMSLASIERCAKKADESQLTDLAQCCRLILKYSTPISTKPSLKDLELLVCLPDQILKSSALQKFGMRPFFENHFAYLIPHIFNSLLANLDQNNFEVIKKFYEMAVNLELLTKQQEENLLFDYLKKLEPIPKTNEISYTLAMQAFEKGISLNQNFFIRQLSQLIKSDNPKYLDFIHRYLNGVADWKVFERENVLKLITELLDTSFKLNTDEMDKKCFVILNKLNECDSDLFNSLFAIHGPRIMEQIQKISRKSLASITKVDPIIFDILGKAIGAMKEKIGSRATLEAFDLQMQLKPDICNLSQLENIAHTAIWLLKNSVKMDLMTQTHWLDKFVLPLLGITFAKVKTNKYNELGKEILNLLTAKDPSKEWLKIVRQRLLLRIASAVGKQKAVIFAQEHLETFTNVFMKIAQDNKMADFIFMGKFQVDLTNKDFLTAQPDRIKLLKAAVKEIDKTLLEHQSFRHLESESGKSSEIILKTTEKAISIPEDINKAAEELNMLLSGSRNYLITRINQLSHFMMSSLKTLSFEALSKDMHALLSNSISQTIKSLASCPKVKTLMFAKEFLNQNSVSKLLDDYQKGQALLELLKGYITIEKLNPQSDYSKELEFYLKAFLKQHELIDKSLDIDGYFAILGLLEKMYKGPWEDVQKISELLEKLCLNPSFMPLVRQKILSSTCIFIQRCLESKNERVSELGVILFKGLVNSPLFSHQDIILRCFEMVLDKINDNHLRLLHEIFIKFKEDKFFEGLSQDLKSKIVSTLLRIQNLKMFDWIFKFMAEEAGRPLEKHEIYFNTLKLLITICEHSSDMKVVNSAHLFFSLNSKTIAPLLNSKGLQSISDDCELLLCTRTQKKEMLLKACEIYERGNLSNKSHSICHLLVGLSKFPFIDFDLTMQSKIWKVLKDLENSDFINKLNPVIIPKIIGLLLVMIKNCVGIQAKYGVQLVEIYEKFLNSTLKFSKDLSDTQKIVDQLITLCNLSDGSVNFKFLYTLQENITKSSLTKEVKKLFLTQVEELVLTQHKELLEFAQRKLKSIATDQVETLREKQECIDFVEKVEQLLPLYALYFPDHGRNLVKCLAKKLFLHSNALFGAGLIFYKLWKKTIEVDLYKEKTDKGHLVKLTHNAKKTIPINLERLEVLEYLFINISTSHIQLNEVITVGFELLPQLGDFFAQDPDEFLRILFPFAVLCMEQSLINETIANDTQAKKGEASNFVKYLQFVQASNVLGRRDGDIQPTVAFLPQRYALIHTLILLPALLNCLHLKIVPSWGVLPCYGRLKEGFKPIKEEHFPSNLKLLKHLAINEPSEFRGLLSSLIFSHPEIVNKSIEIFKNVEVAMSSIIKKCQSGREYMNAMNSMDHTFGLSFQLMGSYIETVFICLRETKDELLKQKETDKIKAYIAFAKKISPILCIPEISVSVCAGLTEMEKDFDSDMIRLEKEWGSKKEKKKDSSDPKGKSTTSASAAAPSGAKKKKGKKR
jgi:hypothetical protein